MAQVELRSILPGPLREFDIVTPGPTARELTRPRDLDFYGEDQRVPYNPAFIEPLTTKSPGGTAKMGVSAWTAPYTPVGPLSAVNPYVGSGAFSLGFTVIWDLLPPGRRPGRAAGALTGRPAYAPPAREPPRAYHVLRRPPAGRRGHRALPRPGLRLPGHHRPRWLDRTTTTGSDIPSGDDRLLVLTGIELNYRPLYQHVGKVMGDRETLYVLNHPARYRLSVRETLAGCASITEAGWPIHAVEITDTGRLPARYDVDEIALPKIATDDSHRDSEFGRAWIEVDAAARSGRDPAGRSRPATSASAYAPAGDRGGRGFDLLDREG